MFKKAERKGKRVVSKPSPNLFLLREPLLADVRASQLDVEHTLHGAENLLVGRSGTLLEVLDDTGGGVALGGKFFLRHLIAFLVSALLDGICDLVTHGLGLDDVVAAVDLGQVLALGGS